jgi:hypothetical protein
MGACLVFEINQLDIDLQLACLWPFARCAARIRSGSTGRFARQLKDGIGCTIVVQFCLIIDQKEKNIGFLSR